MSAVIRMKRHINENPHSAFVLNCKSKKRKTDENSTICQGETSTVLKFAGTVNQVKAEISKWIQLKLNNLFNNFRIPTFKSTLQNFQNKTPQTL
jgi:hypothetical protein